MGTPELEILKSALVRNHRLAEWCTIAVFIGLVVEYTILLWLKRKDFSRAEITLTILAGFSIAGGVYGEYHFGSKASDAALKLSAESEKVVAKTQLDADTAKRDTIAALERISRNEKEAQELKTIAQQEGLARVKVELELAKVNERTKVRHLDTEQARRITSKLKPFPKQKFNLFGYVPDQETVGIANEMLEILVAARHPKDGVGWDSNVFSGNVESGWVTGIEVRLRPDADPSSKEAAEALVKALRAEHLNVLGPLITAEHSPLIDPKSLLGKLDPTRPITIVMGKIR